MFLGPGSIGPKNRSRPVHGVVRWRTTDVPATEKESPVHDLMKRFASRASRRGVLKGGAALGIGAIGLGHLGSRLARRRVRTRWKFSPGGLHPVNLRHCRLSSMRLPRPIRESKSSTQLLPGAPVSTPKPCCRRVCRAGSRRTRGKRTSVANWSISMSFPAAVSQSRIFTRRRVGQTRFPAGLVDASHLAERPVLNPGRRSPWQWILVQQVSHGRQRHRGRRHHVGR